MQGRGLWGSSRRLLADEHPQPLGLWVGNAVSLSLFLLLFQLPELINLRNWKVFLFNLMDRKSFIKSTIWKRTSSHWSMTGRTVIFNSNTSYQPPPSLSHFGYWNIKIMSYSFSTPCGVWTPPHNLTATQIGLNYSNTVSVSKHTFHFLKAVGFTASFCRVLKNRWSL